MPYGTNTRYSSAAGTSIVSVNAFPGGSQTQTQSIGYDISSAKSFWSRSGHNSISVRNRKERDRSPASGHWVLAYRPEPRGPRLHYKVYVPKIKRWVWARRPVMVPYYKWVPIRRKTTPPPSLFLPPNYLYSVRGQTFGTDSSEETLKATHPSDPAWYREVTGSLWYPSISTKWNHGLYNYASELNCSYDPGIDVSGEIADLVTKSYSLFRDRVKNQAVNLGQIIAERRQTADTVYSAVKRLVTALLAAKRGDFGKAARTIFPQDSKQLANDWLLFQYGILPLMSDLQGIVKHATRPEKPLRFTERASRKEIVDKSFVTNTSNGFRCKTTVSLKYEITVKHQAHLEVTFPAARPLAELGLTNLASLGWEVLPWSFVIDWFLPIGDYLNSLDAFSGLRVVSCHRTVFVKKTVKITREFGGADSGGYIWPSHTTVVSGECVGVTRNIITNLPDPPLPELKDPLTWLHTANAVALIRQLFK